MMPIPLSVPVPFVMETSKFGDTHTVTGRSKLSHIMPLEDWSVWFVRARPASGKE